MTQDGDAGLAYRLRVVNTALFFLAVATGLVVHLDTAVAAFPEPGHWPTRHRDLLVVDDTGDAGFAQAIGWAVARWNEAGADFHLTAVRGDGGCERRPGSIAVCPVGRHHLEQEGNPGMEGLTQPDTGRGGHTVAARVLVCSDCRLDWGRKRVVVIHELGHSLGLVHSRDLGSVMYPSGGAAGPSARDVQALRDLYAHADGPDRCGVLNLEVGRLCL